MEDLGKHRFMALTIRLRADIKIDHAVVSKFDLRRLVLVAQNGLDIVRQPDTAQFAVPGTFCFAIRETVNVGLLHGAIKNAIEIPDVVGFTHDCLIGKCILWDEVLAPQFKPVNAKIARSLVHQTLDQIDRFRTTCAAIGVNWCSVGEHVLDVGEHRLEVIDARQDLHANICLDELREGGTICPHIGDGVDPHGLQLVILVKRRFGMCHKIPPAVIRQH